MKPVGIYILLFLALVSSAFAESKKHSWSDDQRLFSAEESAVKHPISIPEDVKMMLSHNVGVRNLLENKNIGTEELPASWFSAATVHLNDSPEQYLMVMAVGDLRGTNVTTFWVFQPSDKGYRLILTATAHTMNIRAVLWKGLREIEFFSNTAVEVSKGLYRYDGIQYALYKSTSEKIH
jgi:hypothetical protein